jgi:hypothetical protein
LAGDVCGELDSPDDGADAKVPTEPDPACACCTGVTITRVVVIARHEFFDMCWAVGQIRYHVCQVQKGCPDVAVFSEADDAGLAFEGLIDGGKSPLMPGRISATWRNLPTIFR